MGAYAWRAQLIRAGRPTSELPRAMRLSPLAPWSFDGARFAYHALDPDERSIGVLLGDTDAGYRWLTGIPISPNGVLWSPRQGLLLVVGQHWFRVFDSHGRLMSSVDWPEAPHGITHGFWLASGQRFAVLGPIGFSPRRTIRLFGSDGDLLAERPLDPVDLVPFNAGEYAHLDRDGFSVILGRSTRAVGWILDEWSDARYEPQTEELRLLVYRPSGPAERDRDAVSHWAADAAKPWVASAEPRWIAIRLSERGG